MGKCICRKGYISKDYPEHEQYFKDTQDIYKLMLGKKDEI